MGTFSVGSIKLSKARRVMTMKKHCRHFKIHTSDLNQVKARLLQAPDGAKMDRIDS
jgi:hypothetical protein